jgi:hypothetical protein
LVDCADDCTHVEVYVLYFILGEVKVVLQVPRGIPIVSSLVGCSDPILFAVLQPHVGVIPHPLPLFLIHY